MGAKKGSAPRTCRSRAGRPGPEPVPRRRWPPPTQRFRETDSLLSAGWPSQSRPAERARQSPPATGSTPDQTIPAARGWGGFCPVLGGTRCWCRPARGFRLDKLEPLVGQTPKVADFSVKSATFHAWGQGWARPQARQPGRIDGKMAELLMNSAIPSGGPMRTSWPKLRNSYYANLVLRSIPAKTPAGQQPCAAAPEPLYALSRPRGRNATKELSLPPARRSW